MVGVSGQVALVTGSTRGIGLATAVLFARAGARVVLNGRSPEPGRDALEVVRQSGGEAVFVQADAATPEGASALVRAALDRWGRLDILVNNAAGGQGPQPFVEQDPAGWPETLRTYFLGPAWCTHAAVKSMVDSGGGSIVHVASDAPRVGTPGLAVIGAAKGGLLAMTKCLGAELARYKIRVNAVCPTLTAGTDSYDRLMSGEFSRRIYSQVEERIPLGISRAEDVAEAICFLASPAAGKITGQILSVNGGLSFPG